MLKNPQNVPQQPVFNSGVQNGGAAVTPSDISNLTSQIETIKIQQHTLREQIQQSERNLTAQHTVNIYL